MKKIGIGSAILGFCIGLLLVSGSRAATVPIVNGGFEVDDTPEFDGHYADNVRAYWGSVPVEESSWGSIKALYND
jgi:hypothetical protein